MPSYSCVINRFSRVPYNRADVEKFYGLEEEGFTYFKDIPSFWDVNVVGPSRVKDQDRATRVRCAEEACFGPFMRYGGFFCEEVGEENFCKNIFA